MTMPQRNVATWEQPERLIAGLQQAQIVDGDPSDEVPVVVGAFQTGLPHGVKSAVVYMEGVRVTLHQGMPAIYFCSSHSYKALRRTLAGADTEHYPPTRRCRISASCRIPAPGVYPARARVSVNGNVDVHIEKFDVRLPEGQEVPVGAA